MRRFTEVEHTADQAFVARGRDLRELFENAAHALLRLQSPGRSPAPAAAGRKPVNRKLAVEGCDPETLLVNWLNEVLFLQETRGEAYHDCKVEAVSSTSIQAIVTGCKNRLAGRLVKAVTFHNLKIELVSGEYRATLVLDV
jgi:SHS2 domain-containing protein